MVLGVLPDPGVTVVDVGGGDVLVHHLRHHHKPLGQEVSLSKKGSTCTKHLSFEVWHTAVLFLYQQQITSFFYDQNAYPESVFCTSVCEVYHQLKRFVVERFQSQQHMIDQEIPINLSHPTMTKKTEMTISQIQIKTIKNK